MTKLVAITLPPLPGTLGALSTVTCDNPNPKIKAWRVMVRGPAVFLVSPPGWVAGKALHEYDKDGPRRVVEVPRGDCTLQWETDDVADVDKLQRFDVPAMGVVEVEQDLEALTAPGKAKK